MQQLITGIELDCIRFYMGDPVIVNRGDFRGGPDAHNTINALLHGGVDNELAKLKEGRSLEIIDQSHLISYFSLIEQICSAMIKYRAQHNNIPRVTYRVDRTSAIRRLKDTGRLEGFYSTCKWGYLPEYAHTKSHVALMEIVRDEDVPCLDFEMLFQGYYAKPREAEILLPFDAEIDRIEELPLTEQEQEIYTDLHGNPPEGKYRLYVMRHRRESHSQPDADALFASITSKERVHRARRCLQLLAHTHGLPPEELAFYTQWKSEIRDWLHIKLPLFH